MFTAAGKLAAQVLNEPQTDPFFSSVKALMHMEGADGGTTFTDLIGHTITTTGTVTTSTVVHPYGTSSALFSAAGRLGFPTGTDFVFPGDFTIEFTFVPNTITGNQVVIGNYTANAGGHWMFRLQGAVYVWYYNGAAFTMNVSGIVAGNVYKIALVRSGTTMSGYINGVLSGTPGTLSGNYGLSTNVVSMGARSDGTDPYSGYLDEVRITNGVARYTSNYTPRKTPFPNNA